MMRWFGRAGVVLLAACGVTGPDDSGARLRVSGTVVSTTTGAPIAGATVFLMFQPAFSSWQTAYALTQASTNGNGRYSMEIGPPPGYAAPNLSTLHLEASAPGYSRGWFGISSPESTHSPGAIEHSPIQLSPLVNYMGFNGDDLATARQNGRGVGCVASVDQRITADAPWRQPGDGLAVVAALRQLGAILAQCPARR